MPGESKDLLSREAYETFCKDAGNRSPLPWEELPPLVQDAWRVTVTMIVDRVLQSEAAKETEETWKK